MTQSENNNKMNKTPSSIVSFKNGYSFVCVPINLEEVKESKESEDAAVGTQIRNNRVKLKLPQ